MKKLFSLLAFVVLLSGTLFAQKVDSVEIKDPGEFDTLTVLNDTNHLFLGKLEGEDFKNVTPPVMAEYMKGKLGTEAMLDSTKVVKVAGEQDITGKKNFTGGINLGNDPIENVGVATANDEATNLGQVNELLNSKADISDIENAVLLNPKNSNQQKISGDLKVGSSYKYYDLKFTSQSKMIQPDSSYLEIYAGGGPSRNPLPIGLIEIGDSVIITFDGVSERIDSTYVVKGITSQNNFWVDLPNQNLSSQVSTLGELKVGVAHLGKIITDSLNIIDTIINAKLEARLNSISSENSGNVKLTGDQTIAGDKTFIDNVIVSDDVVLQSNIAVLGTSSFSGELLMNNNKIRSLSEPILDNDAATKQYVDDKEIGLDSSNFVKLNPTGKQVVNKNFDFGFKMNLVGTEVTDQASGSVSEGDSARLAISSNLALFEGAKIGDVVQITGGTNIADGYYAIQGVPFFKGFDGVIDSSIWINHKSVGVNTVGATVSWFPNDNKNFTKTRIDDGATTYNDNFTPSGRFMAIFGVNANTLGFNRFSDSIIIENSNASGLPDGMHPVRDYSGATITFDVPTAAIGGGTFNGQLYVNVYDATLFSPEVSTTDSLHIYQKLFAELSKSSSIAYVKFDTITKEFSYGYLPESESSVTTDITLTGDGSSGDPLKIDTTKTATKSFVESEIASATGGFVELLPSGNATQTVEGSLKLGKGFDYYDLGFRSRGKPGNPNYQNLYIEDTTTPDAVGTLTAGDVVTIDFAGAAGRTNGTYTVVGVDGGGFWVDDTGYSEVDFKFSASGTVVNGSEVKANIEASSGTLDTVTANVVNSGEYQTDDLPSDAAPTKLVTYDETEDRFEDVDYSVLYDVAKLVSDSLTGWHYLKGDDYVTGSRLNVTSLDTFDYLVNGLVDNLTTQLPTGISEFWNTTSDKIVPERNGDTYELRIDFLAEPQQVDAFLNLYLDIGDGTTPIYIVKRLISLPRGSGVEHPVSVGFPIFVGSTFIANGGKIKLQASSGDNVEVWDTSVFISRIHRSK